MVTSSLHRHVESVCKEYFSSNTHYVLAISGGVDSIVLLDIMSDLFPQHCFVVTIDHHIRSTSSQDTNLVAAFCQKKQLPYRVEHINMRALSSHGTAVEETARRERYRILEKIRIQRKAQAVVTAHHAQDQVETQIMHLIRGCNVKGLVGMEVWSDRCLFRPFLTVSKAELIKYARHKNLVWHEDETNTDTRYLRNHIRKHWSEQLTEVLSPMSQIATEIEAISTTILGQWERKHHIPEKPFKRSCFYELPFYLRLMWLHQLLTKHFQVEDVSAAWVGQLYHWFENARSGSEFKYKGTRLVSYHSQQFTIFGTYT